VLYTIRDSPHFLLVLLCIKVTGFVKTQKDDVFIFYHIIPIVMSWFNILPMLSCFANLLT